MPELPEVETIRAGLSRLLPGKTIKSVTHDTPKSFPNAGHDVQEFLIDARIVAVRRRAKVLLIELDSDYSLVIHLKMTGQLVFVASSSVDEGTPGKSSSHDEVRFGGGHPTDSLIAVLPDKSTRVTFTFTDESQLFFNDQRKFGWVRLLPTVEVPNIDFMRRVGPEPLEPDFTWQLMKQRLARRKNTNIKAALLDQSVIAGVGNIYADETLWGARLHPTTLVKHLTDDNIKDLHLALIAALELSIEKGGSTSHTYVDAEGNKGSYLNFANVFRREGQPCRRCGTTIEKIRVAGRGTHVCPVCQRVRMS